ncbi:MAG TPA: polyprenyl synthetase family protein [Clostridiales bacterium]|nr:polyprenyl synthetase family protein [Clostridiales bacterium]
MDFQKTYQEKVLYINEGLNSIIRQRESHPTVLRAMEYSLQAGGKRLRPVLFLSAYEFACIDNCSIQELDQVRPMACALEMIHTYSLIHDDLPAMDNDDYRRGKPTNHKVFGEAIAILAGDGLLNLAYEVMLENVPLETEKLNRYIKAMLIISRSAGVSGMIGGQTADMENQGSNGNFSELEYIHTHKTEALITASLKSGVIAKREDTELLNAVAKYGKALGMAFQITDDILDLTGDLQELGKMPGSDKKMSKLTYPARYGLEMSKKMSRQYIEQAVSCLEPYGKKGEFLKLLALSILDRSR